MNLIYKFILNLYGPDKNFSHSSCEYTYHFEFQNQSQNQFQNSFKIDAGFILYSIYSV